MNIKKNSKELIIAIKELAFQNTEKEKRAAELVIANNELTYQNKEKEKRAAELIIANKELLFQNEEKEKRAAELIIANKELLFQNEEKEKRAAELIIANKELLFQNEEKEKRAAELIIAYKELAIRVKEISDYKYALDESSILAITDQKGIITYVNNNFCKISKYSAAELIGEDHRIINSGYHSKEFIRNLWVTIANGKPWRGELKNKAKDGSIYWVDTTIIPFLDEQAKPYKYAAIRADITLRKLAEDRLNELHENLVIQTKELAISNAELEQFAYVASHDLLEPLRMVTSFLTQLEKKYGNVIDEKGKKYIHFAVDGAKRMRQIILDLLEFSRVGRVEDKLEDVNLNEVVVEIQTLFRKEISDKKAVLHVDRLPVINSYNAPLRQAFQNLISNALKYSVKDQACKIDITVSELNDHWQFGVTDNGIGIAEEYFDKIFIIFQRLHNKEEFSGTGMGLAVTKKIIENLGGKIWIKSELNKGSTFYFTMLKAKQD